MQISTIPAKVVKAQLELFSYASRSIELGFSYYHGVRHDEWLYSGIVDQLKGALWSRVAPRIRFDADQLPFLKKATARCLASYRNGHYKKYGRASHHSVAKPAKALERYYHLAERSLPAPKK